MQNYGFQLVESCFKFETGSCNSLMPVVSIGGANQIILLYV